MKIVKPQIQDLPKLIELWTEQYEYHHDLDNEYYVPNSSELTLKFEKYLNNAIAEDDPNILCAFDEEGIILGFITFEIAEADYFDTNIERYGEVIELFVDIDSRKTGVGKTLLEAAEDYFSEQGIEWVELQVSTFNKNALDVYKHLSYTNRQTLMFKKLP